MKELIEKIAKDAIKRVEGDKFKGLINYSDSGIFTSKKTNKRYVARVSVKEAVKS